MRMSSFVGHIALPGYPGSTGDGLLALVAVPDANTLSLHRHLYNVWGYIQNVSLILQPNENKWSPDL